ncbi:MAG: hypothetical protein ABT940_11290 [Alphaproteobacteria bacterium]
MTVPYPTDLPCRPGVTSERRVICAAFDMWDRLRGDSDLPDIAELDLSQYPRIAPHVYVVRLARELAHSVIVHSGPVLNQAFGISCEGLTLAEVMPISYREQLMGYVASVMIYRKPLAETDVIIEREGKELIHRNVLMPASDHGGHKVTHLLCAFSCRPVS